MYIYQLKKMIKNQSKYKSSSQFNEDLYLVEIFNGNAGVIVDVGANDGAFGSNSMLLESLSWDTILIEPNPDLCDYIHTHRKPSHLFQFAASSKEGVVTLYLVDGNSLAHGLSTLEPTKENLERIEVNNFTYRKVEVIAKTLDAMLAETNVKKVDVISIDVEGHEVEALKGFSINKWKPTVLIIEDNSMFTSDEVVNYMENYGYSRFFRTGVNDWYARKENKQFVNWKNTSHYNLNRFKEKYWVRKVEKLKIKLKQFSFISKLVYAVKNNSFFK
jgi:FkbM family methyltransferase